MFRPSGNIGEGTIVVDLVDQEDAPVVPEQVQSTMDITRMIQAIRLLEKQIHLYEVQDQQSRAFYAQRIGRCEERITTIKRSILAFLQHFSMKNIQTPAGTAYQRTVVEREWPSDETLLAWCQSHKPDAIRTKQEPDKRILGEHIRTTGEVPDGYTETKAVRLYLK